MRVRTTTLRPDMTLRAIPWMVVAVMTLGTQPEARLDQRPSAQAAAFKIVVIAGEDAVNIIQQKTAVDPVVEVRDRNDLPIAGVLLTFTVRGGRNAALNGGLKTVSATTNVAGRATVKVMPTGSGIVQIDVSATHQGQTVSTTINQGNFATASDAAKANPASQAAAAAASAGGGGLSAGVIAAVAGGVAAAAGGVVAASRGGDEPAASTGGPGSGGSTPPTGTNRVPAIASVTPSTTLALQGATVTFSAQASDQDNDLLTYAWDFGDGTTSSVATPTHAYTTSGTFPVRLTVSDGRASAGAQASVTVRDVTGRWVGTMTCPPARCGSNVQLAITFDVTQSGKIITGTSRQIAPNSSSPDICTFSTGLVQLVRQVYFGQLQGCNLVQLNYGGCVGELDDSLNRMLPDTGGFPPGEALTCDLVRQ